MLCAGNIHRDGLNHAYIILVLPGLFSLSLMIGRLLAGSYRQRCISSFPLLDTEEM